MSRAGTRLRVRFSICPLTVTLATHIFQETHDGTENPPRREEKFPATRPDE